MTFRIPSRCLQVICALILWGAPQPVAADDWSFGVSYFQGFPIPQDNFEIVLAGNPQIDFRGLPPLNAFDDPLTSAGFDLRNTTVYFRGSNSLPRDLSIKHSFGIHGTGPKPKLKRAYWTPGDPTTAQVPVASFDWSILNAERLLVTINNSSDFETITATEVGYRLLPNLTIDQLNEHELPPDSFNSLTMLNGELLPGGSRQVTLADVSPRDFVALYATVRFSGNSSNNEYQEIGGAWWGGPVPEPSSLVLAGVFGVTVAAYLLQRHSTKTQLQPPIGRAVHPVRTVTLSTSTQVTP